MRTLRRLAEAHTPITAFELMTFVGTEPFAVSLLIGTWIAIVWQLIVSSVSTPSVAAVGIRCRFSIGRRSARSKIDPMSTKNGSLR